MPGTTSPMPTSGGSTTLLPIVKSNMNDKMWSMGLGVITGGVYGLEGPELIKTYVEITKVDADGTVHFKKAKDTDKEEIYG